MDSSTRAGECRLEEADRSVALDSLSDPQQSRLYGPCKAAAPDAWLATFASAMRYGDDEACLFILHIAVHA